MASSDTSRSVAAMLAATAVLSVSDALVRLTTEGMPIGEFLLLRGILSTLVMAMIVMTSPARQYWRNVGHRLVILRALLEASAVVLYIAALQKLMIAEVTAIYLTSPILMSVILVLFFLERISWQGWLALFAGFLGVLLIVRPGTDNLNMASMLALGSAVFVALRDIVTRRTPMAAPSSVVTLCTTAAVALSGVLLMPFEPAWAMPSGGQMWLLVAASACGMVGNLLAVAAFRAGNLAVTALFRYASLPFALLVGWVVWREFPAPVQVVGSVLVCASGAFAFLAVIGPAFTFQNVMKWWRRPPV